MAGLLLVVSGPSGAGKDTVLHEAFKNREDIFYSISATTRSMRSNEENGKHYYFMEKDEFEAKIANGEMLEYAEYVGNYYGTPMDSVESNLEKGNNVVLKIEVQGAAEVKKKCPACVMIFILPPSFDELVHRLKERNTDDERTTEKRIGEARNEIEKIGAYDYLIINDDYKEAANTLNKIIENEKGNANPIAGNAEIKNQTEFITRFTDGMNNRK